MKNASSRERGRPIGRWLAFAPVLVLLAVLAASWGVPVLDEHGFRQAQTLVSSYWMTRGDAWWLYPTPVLGYPWSVPFEFPLYQWAVALLAMLPFGPDIDAAGRLVSTLAMVACLWPLRATLRGLGAPERLVDIATALFILSPLHLFWGRAAMIESTVLLLSLVFVLCIQRLVARITPGWLLAAIVFAVLAALVKVTTFFAFALLAGALVAAELLRRARRRDLRRAVVLAIASALPIALALAALLGWLHASDQIKLGSVLAEFSTSKNLSGWNFDQQPLRMVDAFWRDVVLRRMLPDILGHAMWLLPLALILLAPSRRRWLPWLAAALALFLAPMLVFTKLHFIHNYYQMANATFLLVALAVVLHAVSERWRGAGAAALVALAGIGMLLQFHGGYWPLIRNVDPNHRSLVVAGVLRQHTAPDDVVVTMGLTWSSEVPYYAKRRAVMLLQDDFQPFVPALLRAPGGEGLLRLGAVVRCGPARTDISTLEPLFCGPLREIDAAGCSIIVRRDIGPSAPDEAGCERAIADKVQAGLQAPAAGDGPVLAPFEAEWQPFRAADSCNIEFVGDGVTPVEVIGRDRTLTVGGWFLSRPAMARPAAPALRLRSDSLGRSWYVPLEQVVPREDLVAAFGPEAARSGGFSVDVPLASLPPGRYDLMLVDQAGESPALCRPPNKFVMVH
jgi:4-amino-4-deoxy-L-arabinose transferase-like glycosyltransferase